MDIGQRYIDHGPVDFVKLRDAVLACPEKLWFADDGLKESLAKDRPTKSLFLSRVSVETLFDTLRRRPLRQKDIEKHSSWQRLHQFVEPILNRISELYAADGLFISIQIACLPKGEKITRHTDHSQVLVNSHRLHVPLVTHDKIEFMIDDERVILAPGTLYEINNQKMHSVENCGDEDRLHLIIDYLPADRNNTKYFEVQKLQQRMNSFSSRVKNRKFPKLIATSVIRGAYQSESHGGIYLVDMQTSEIDKKYDWNRGDIDFQGRGWDRGLRGIAFFDGDIYVAASDEIFQFNQNFEITKSYKNPYLKHAHEMHVYKEKLYITSTGYDSILRFDLKSHAFDQAVVVRRSSEGKLLVNNYDPNSQSGPKFKNTLHLNQVYCDKRGLYVCGRRLPYFLLLDKGNAQAVCKLPDGTHNAQPYKSGFLLNDTESDRIVYFDNLHYAELPFPAYPEDEIQNMKYADERLARQSFGRGLCEENGIIYAGSSPSTISAFDLTMKRRIKSINISMDIRNAVHGLAIWPY